MVDFAKLLNEPRKPRLDYLYRCSRCDCEEWYWIEMPPHMLSGCVDPMNRRCRGPMVLIATQPEGKPEERKDMGIAEIQAALAQGAPASANPFAAPTAAPAAPQAPAFQPSPFGAPPTAAPNPFGGSAPAPAFQPPPLPPAPAPAALTQQLQTAFAFNPPPGFNPATTPPINPPGERASLNSVGATGAPAELAADVAQNFTRPADPASLGPQPTVEPKRRGRKPKATITITGQTGVQVEERTLVVDGGAAEARKVADFIGQGASDELASPAEVVLGSISTEDLVAVLRERGYSVWLEAKS